MTPNLKIELTFENYLVANQVDLSAVGSKQLKKERFVKSVSLQG